MTLGELMEVFDGSSNLGIYPQHRMEAVCYKEDDHSWDGDWTVYSNWLVYRVYMSEELAEYPGSICIEITNPEGAD